MNELFDRAEQAVVHERQADYGDPRICHAAIAHAWCGIINQCIQRDSNKLAASEVRFGPYEVALMMAAMKIIRLAYGYKDDSMLDARVYLKFAEEFSRGGPR